MLFSYPSYGCSDYNETSDELNVHEKKVDIPHPVFEKVMSAYSKGDLTNIDMQDLLQTMFLKYSPAYMRANILFLEKKDGNEKILGQLDEARKQVVSIRWKPVYEIYKYAQEIKNCDLNSAWHKAWQTYPSWAGLYQYRIDLVNEKIDAATLEFEYEQLYLQAQKGLRPAMLMLADHYERGFNLEKSAFNSAFWLYQAQWEGAEIDNGLARLKQSLKDEDISKIKQMIKENKYPDLMKKPKTGWAMSGGPNKRWTPPYMR